MFESHGENLSPSTLPRNAIEPSLDDGYVSFHALFGQLSPATHKEMINIATMQSQEILALLFGGVPETEVEYRSYDGDEVILERYLETDEYGGLSVQKHKKINTETGTTKPFFTVSTAPMVDLSFDFGEKSRMGINPNTVFLPDEDVVQDQRDAFAWLLLGHDRLQRIGQEYCLPLRDNLDI